MSDWLRKLVDATPMPPCTDDADALLAAFADMSRTRRPLLAEPPRERNRDAALRAELDLRHDAWQAALAAARLRVGAQRVAASKAARYQRGP